jgi:uncharacterized membrane protein
MGAAGSGDSAVSPELFETTLHWISLGMEAAGVGAIVLGGILAAIAAGLQVRDGWESRYHRFRAQFARSILLGLEFLVAADIIGTVAVEPTLQNLAVLGLIVAIRTFLSFSLEVEIEGQWPWQRAARSRDDGRE